MIADSLVKFSDPVFPIPRAKQQIAETLMNGDAGWIASNGLAVLDDRLLRPTIRHQCYAEIVVRNREIRTECYCNLEVANLRGRFTQFCHSHAHLEIDVKVLRMGLLSC